MKVLVSKSQHINKEVQLYALVRCAFPTIAKLIINMGDLQCDRLELKRPKE